MVAQIYDLHRPPEDISHIVDIGLRPAKALYNDIPTALHQSVYNRVAYLETNFCENPVEKEPCEVTSQFFSMLMGATEAFKHLLGELVGNAEAKAKYFESMGKLSNLPDEFRNSRVHKSLARSYEKLYSATEQGFGSLSEESSDAPEPTDPSLKLLAFTMMINNYSLEQRNLDREAHEAAANPPSSTH